jgi:hypothetical protein
LGGWTRVEKVDEDEGGREEEEEEQLATTWEKGWSGRW